MPEYAPASYPSSSRQEVREAAVEFNESERRMAAFVRRDVSRVAVAVVVVVALFFLVGYGLKNSTKLQLLVQQLVNVSGLEQ